MLDCFTRKHHQEKQWDLFPFFSTHFYDWKKTYDVIKILTKSRGRHSSWLYEMSVEPGHLAFTRKLIKCKQTQHLQWRPTDLSFLKQQLTLFISTELLICVLIKYFFLHNTKILDVEALLGHWHFKSRSSLWFIGASIMHLFTLLLIWTSRADTSHTSIEEPWTGT